MTTALIDGDIVAFRCAASCEPTKEKLEREPIEHAIGRADELIYRINNTVASDKHRIFLGSTENFRRVWYPDYKANRVQPKPVYLDAVRNFLVEEWGAELCAGYEADDGIGISTARDTVICSIDKDLRQLSGWHYNFVKNELDEVSYWDAIRAFYCQLLTGDRSDNVKGIDGIGPVRSERLLSDCQSAKELEARVRSIYEEAGRDERAFILNYRLLRVVRSREELTEIEMALAENKPAFYSDLYNFKEEAHESRFGKKQGATAAEEGSGEDT